MKTLKITKLQQMDIGDKIWKFPTNQAWIKMCNKVKREAWDSVNLSVERSVHNQITIQLVTQMRNQFS